MEQEKDSKESSPRQPLFFSVQNFCLHDGPGIRSIVFFKGCPLRCKWCHNPESWSLNPQLGYKKHLCLGCKTCVETCLEGVMSGPGKWDSDICTQCFKCVEKCPSEALVCFGVPRTVESIVEELRPEYTYYKNSGGGVTFSGGESTLFPEFSGELAKAFRSEGVNVAAETCGLFRLEGIRQINGASDFDVSDFDVSGFDVSGLHGKVWDFLSQLNLILFDVKVFDNDEHRRLCGVGNEMITQNLRVLASLMKSGSGPPVWPRLPLIPGMTDTGENLAGWAEFLQKAGLNKITVIPYHNLGESKKTWIGTESDADIPELSDADLARAKDILSEHGMTCYSPGDENWEQFL